MSRRSEGLFAGRGISWRTAAITVVVVIVAFAAGIGAGWGTSKIPGMYRAANETSPSPTPTPTPTPSIVVSVPPLEPIDRELTEDDGAAGVVSLDYTLHGEDTFSAVPGEDPIPSDGAPVRLVRVDVEDGIDINGPAFADYVMDILNDPRGWGSENRMHFVRTEGVPDVRIVIASPYTVAALCPNPHATGQGASATREPTTDNGETATPTADATCADRGTAAISQYDWIAGLPGYGDDIVGARQYLITHDTGHILGEAEGECVRGTALVMAHQREPMEDCETNPWAFPDAPVPAETSSPDPSPSS
ncbi:DUF3152 domain-containing protein [Demequina aurantiaca]|uniref:DUF3152 domain-containing protein n=1 Tax=Demequina aurantiaca TaxID=676200 RepID=UPI0007845DD6|nr:DUF3152 domain-containing protein [Demequina aurantiaca]